MFKTSRSSRTTASLAPRQKKCTVLTMGMVGKARQVYADAQDDRHRPADYYERRELHWKSNQPVSPADFAKLIHAAVPEGYNDFDPRRVSDIFLRHKDVCIELAREGSPTVYVSGPLAALNRLKDLQDKLGADEAHIKNGRLRLWWD